MYQCHIHINKFKYIDIYLCLDSGIWIAERLLIILKAMYISFKSLRLTIVVNILVHRWWVSKGLRLLIQPTLRFHKQHYSFTVGSRHPNYRSQLASLLYRRKPTPQLWLLVRITLRRIFFSLMIFYKEMENTQKTKTFEAQCAKLSNNINLLFLFL